METESSITIAHAAKAVMDTPEQLQQQLKFDPVCAGDIWWGESKGNLSELKVSYYQMLTFYKSVAAAVVAFER